MNECQALHPEPQDSDSEADGDGNTVCATLFQSRPNMFLFVRSEGFFKMVEENNFLKHLNLLKVKVSEVLFQQPCIIIGCLPLYLIQVQKCSVILSSI